MESHSNSSGGTEPLGGSQGDSSNKRVAHAGQWRTPPLPVFPSGYNPHHSHNQQAPPQQQQQQQRHQSMQQSHVLSPTLAAPTSIPANSEDYAKALQEAYRKGAEAAARMAQEQQHIPTAASCPNFSRVPHSPPPHSMDTNTSNEEAAYARQVHPQPTHSAMPDPLTSYEYMPPPPQNQAHAVVTHAPPQQHHHPQQHPPLPQQEYSTTQSESAVASSKASRSVSLPDMSAYAAQAEEEKRQKRLARNRASARLRRLRKKNLVDAYETEVGILEKTLKQLQAHEWGKDDDHKALLDALGMERGQQAIRPDQRTSIIQDILKQQMQQVELLRQSQLEQECLVMLAENDQDELSKELQGILQLSDAQKQQLLGSSKALEEEIEALETVAASLQAMLDNEWLLNEGVQNITDQFTSILHKNQLSKFLLWTDANAESIDQVDHVQVQPLQGAPIFSFGVETTPGDDDEK